MLKKKSNFWKLAILAIGLIALIFAGFFVYKFNIKKEIVLKKEQKTGNINLLILGIGGGTHDGPNLTDTIIVAMVNPTKNTVNLVSVPRDLWIPDINGKINKTYQLGLDKNDTSKLLVKSVVKKVTGKQIDYVVVIDFSGFVKLVDYLGGIDVDVAHTLDDYNYPIEGKETDLCGHPEEEVKDFVATGPAELEQWEYFTCRYKHLHVDQGMQHMDGETALQFSRSRHGINGEGSDFARSRRQQEVISAIKSKVLSLGIILNPVKVIGILNILKDNIDTDITPNEYDDFINLAQKMQKAKISSYVIDFGDQSEDRFGLLKEDIPSQSKGFQYNLIPRVGDGDFSEINSYVNCVAGNHMCDITEKGLLIDPTPTPSVTIKPSVKR
ncbi:MAG TPA: LCP family protein [Patescibacteria group bacterium]|nr:LCP family protein [Patescibacteria group bacterium]